MNRLLKRCSNGACFGFICGPAATVVNLVTFLFVKVASAVVVAITTPFKVGPCE